MSVKNSSQLRPDMTNELVRIVAGTRECFGFIQLVIYIDKINTCYPEVIGKVLHSYFNLMLRPIFKGNLIFI